MQLIIGTSPIEIEETERYPDAGLRSWRWQLKLNCRLWKPSLSINLDKQVKYAHGDPGWLSAVSYFCLMFEPLNWSWRSISTYYNGQHYALTYGPFGVYWCE